MASRFTSHSHGPGRVSSKSFTSKTWSRSGVAKIPKFARCASPQSWTRRSVIGVVLRSRAMIDAAPRKNANGEAAILPYRMGRRLASRARSDRSRSSTGSPRSRSGDHLACDERGILRRIAFPAAYRSARHVGPDPFVDCEERRGIAHILCPPRGRRVPREGASLPSGPAQHRRP